MALEKLEMHDIQDKTRLLDEMNETRDGVNNNRQDISSLQARVKDLLMRTQKAPKVGPKSKK